VRLVPIEDALEKLGSAMDRVFLWAEFEHLGAMFRGLELVGACRVQALTSLTTSSPASKWGQASLLARYSTFTGYGGTCQLHSIILCLVSPQSLLSCATINYSERAPVFP